MSNFISESNEEDTGSTLCKICIKSQRKYTCPRCGISYCSLACYRSELHGECSEEFSRQWILDTMKQDVGDAEAEQKMKEILHRFQQSEQNDIEELDSDDDCEEDLADRMSSVNLDDPDSVWEKLTTAEKQEFTDLIKNGDVTELLPTWKPWWNFRKEKKLVVEVESMSSDAAELEKYMNSCPSVKDASLLSQITKTRPSVMVKNNVQNVLAAYCYVSRWFNGDHHSFVSEAVQTLTTLSCNLSQGSNYSSAEMAIEAVALEVTSCSWLDGSPDSVMLMRQDLHAVLAGPDDANITFYLLAALSDIYALLLTASKSKAKQEKTNSEFSRRFPDYPDQHERVYLPRDKIKHCAKKVEYYISWAKENGTEVCVVSKSINHPEILTTVAGCSD